MTPNTSSSSADGTTEDSKPDRTGRPPIGMLSGRTSLGDWEFRWWSAKVKARHWIGIHTLVPTEIEAGHPRVTYTVMKCWRCDYEEPW
jgi:hypothetical protein